MRQQLPRHVTGFSEFAAARDDRASIMAATRLCHRFARPLGLHPTPNRKHSVLQLFPVR